VKVEEYKNIVAEGESNREPKAACKTASLDYEGEEVHKVSLNHNPGVQVFQQKIAEDGNQFSI
jgi:hypothetical protein